MYTTNARSLIQGAAKLFGGLAQGEVPTADLENDAYAILNQMIDEWATQPWTSSSITRSTFTWPASTLTVTIGTSGTVNQFRPERILQAGYILASSPAVEVPISVLTFQEYAAIPIKTLTSTVPTAIYYNPTFPLGTLELWPTPTTTVSTVIYVEAPLAQFTDLTTDSIFPPGYANALKYNLSVLLAPEWGMDLPDGIERYAALYLGRLKRANFKLSVRPNAWDAAFHGGVYDILSDTVR